MSEVRGLWSGMNIPESIISDVLGLGPGDGV